MGFKKYNFYQVLFEVLTQTILCGVLSWPMTSMWLSLLGGDKMIWQKEMLTIYQLNQSPSGLGLWLKVRIRIRCLNPRLIAAIHSLQFDACTLPGAANALSTMNLSARGVLHHQYYLLVEPSFYFLF